MAKVTIFGLIHNHLAEPFTVLLNILQKMFETGISVELKPSMALINLKCVNSARRSTVILS